MTHRTAGSEAYLLRRDDGRGLLYDRLVSRLWLIDEPARLAGRGTWVPFDGDPEPILEEAVRLDVEGSA